MKLKKVKDTKNPTIKQMISISENLRAHLNTYIDIKIHSQSFNHVEKTNVIYGIYIASDDKGIYEFKSWEELLSFYHKLMKGEIDES